MRSTPLLMRPRMIRRMRRATRHRIITWSTLIGIAVVSLVALAISLESNPTPPTEPQPEPQHAQDPTAEPTAEPISAIHPLEGLELDPDAFELVDGRYIQRLDDGRIVHLTLDPELQKAVPRHIDKRKTPQAGVVAIEPSTGRVLSLVSRTHGRRFRMEHFALKAQAPSASVFKLITAAALIDLAKVNPKRKVCYSGGRSFLTEEQIKGNPTETTESCGDLGDAIGNSLNVVMSRLAYYHLSKQNLEEMALRFGFNREIPFELPVEISEAIFVDDDIERARTAAGFWNVNLSPLHGALIAAAIGNHGIMMRPTLVDRIESAEGETLYTFTPRPWLTPLSKEHAALLAKLGENTTLSGTASKVFRKHKRWPNDLSVTGKTGTLSNKQPYTLYTWFVGSSPVENPNIAVGALTGNTGKWWVKGMHAAAHTIRSYHYIRLERAKANTPE